MLPTSDPHLTWLIPSLSVTCYTEAIVSSTESKSLTNRSVSFLTSVFSYPLFPERAQIRQSGLEQAQLPSPFASTVSLCYLFLAHPLATSFRNLPLAIFATSARPSATSRFLVFSFLFFFTLLLRQCPRDCCITHCCPQRVGGYTTVIHSNPLCPFSPSRRQTRYHLNITGDSLITYNLKSLLLCYW